jgi:hypothetical protein
MVCTNWLFLLNIDDDIFYFYRHVFMRYLRIIHLVILFAMHVLETVFVLQYREMQKKIVTSYFLTSYKSAIKCKKQ